MTSLLATSWSLKQTSARYACLTSGHAQQPIQTACMVDTLDFIRAYSVTVQATLPCTPERIHIPIASIHLAVVHLKHTMSFAVPTDSTYPDSNVLLYICTYTQISDFGLSKHMNKEGVYQREKLGAIPLKWTSPEVCLLPLSSRVELGGSHSLVFCENTFCPHPSSQVNFYIKSCYVYSGHYIQTI